MAKRSLIMLFVILMISSVFSVGVIATGEGNEATGEAALKSSDPDEAVKEIFTEADETYVKSTYDKLGWILWILLGAIFMTAVIIISKWIGGKIR
ncbi:MAG: hypothetical protein E7665_00515 [Ruminococcaceae bacterium]|nr:hypothetical protein [Oscillospiraceae bacterium]